MSLTKAIYFSLVPLMSALFFPVAGAGFDETFFRELIEISDDALVEQLGSLPDDDEIEYALAVAKYKTTQSDYRSAEFCIEYVIDRFSDNFSACSRAWFLKATISLYREDEDRYYESIDKAVEYSIRAKEHQHTKYYLHAKASRLRSAGRLGDAKKVLDELLEVFQVDPDDAERIVVLSETALVSYKIGDIETSKKLALAANSLNKSVRNLRVQGILDKVLGNISRAEGNLEMASEYLTKAIQVFTQLEEFHELGNCLYNKALVEGASEDYRKAITSLYEALYVFTQQGSSGGVGMCYATMGSYSTKLGEYEQARLLLSLAEYFNDRADSQFRLAQTYMFIGHLECELDDDFSASESYMKSKRIFEELGLESYVKKLSDLIGETRTY